ncbi:bifunctional riboflavin kinase/FMN adenylyltransferase [Spiroplasma gladiatoris]|uniref:FAD synthase n=1 Tax=Spiroplasma gladiatoris TaxID=2143 RepID=A0A4P7AIQ4_9MOLU|nr:hypothetical protein [Spiroplasma gladiatoris]QBQ07603.1 bifunctional riboflavin kinase/FMN adenylyltransferase [Spiroplasma gladiatoris]
MQLIDIDFTKLNYNFNKKNTICIGFFDGVHKLHQKIMLKTKSIAKENNESFSIMTFSKKVSDFLKNQSNNLQSKKVKYQILQNLFEPDYLFEIQVNKKTISKSKSEFISYLKDILNANHIIVGSDFTFGYKREGKIDDLYEAFGKENVYVFNRNFNYSTSNLKQLLYEGKIEQLNDKIGYFYKVILKKIPNKSNTYKIHQSNSILKNGYYLCSINNKEIKIKFENNVTYLKNEFNYFDSISIEIIKYLNK